MTTTRILHRLMLPALLALAAAACGGDGDPVAGRDFRDLPADQVMFDALHDIKDLGVLRARLHADTSYVYEDSATTLMFPVDLRLFDENGAETAHLTAESGELDTRSNQMVARGNVVLITTEGDRRILTEELHYDPRSRRVWSDVETVVFEGDTRLQGEGFSADQGMQNIEVRKGTGENIQIEF
jgi:LPS export ABC transporter protein LptC